MKKITLLLFLPLILLTASRGQDGTDAVKIMNELKKQSPIDPLYSSLVNNYLISQDKATKGLKKGIQFETTDPARPGLLQELKTISPADISQVKSVVSNSFDNADELLELTSKNLDKLKELKIKFPDLFTLKPEETADVLTTAATTYYDIEQNSNGLLAPGGISTGPDAGPCETGRDRDRARCHRNARMESAICGIMTSTLLGSLICGAYVLFHERNCMDQAQIDYLYCLAGK